MEKRRKYVPTLLFAWFLGWFGIHRFYTGYKGIGIAILLCTLVLPFLTCGISFVVSLIWVMVDFISLCFNCYVDADDNQLAEYDPIIGKLVFTFTVASFMVAVFQYGFALFDVIQTGLTGQ